MPAAQTDADPERPGTSMPHTEEGGKEGGKAGQEELSEAVARAAEEHPGDIDRQIEVALQCPCVEDMMTSPCKDTFVDSFTCFMKSEHPEAKGYDCVSHFERFQECLTTNPGVIDQFLSNTDGGDEGLTTD